MYATASLCRLFNFDLDLRTRIHDYVDGIYLKINSFLFYITNKIIFFFFFEKFVKNVQERKRLFCATKHSMKIKLFCIFFPTRAHLIFVDRIITDGFVKIRFLKFASMSKTSKGLGVRHFCWKLLLLLSSNVLITEEL